ncbi:hypothetical protein QVD17_07792 [Tagetes erecta]|uniref:Uncharacterized protein n=1 Tax=Tagetes erecta TaxID=13708 RepID=A0AAD8L4Y1_TARER|nr:hypothetical protein QVD17_07792 [Tagetes erecta]
MIYCCKMENKNIYKHYQISMDHHLLISFNHKEADHGGNQREDGLRKTKIFRSVVWVRMERENRRLTRTLSSGGKSLSSCLLCVLLGKYDHIKFYLIRFSLLIVVKKPVSFNKYTNLFHYYKLGTEQ